MTSSNTIENMKRAMLVAIPAAVALSIGGGAAAYAATSSPAPVPPTQTIRTGLNVTDWCITFGTNKPTYDWNQTACPPGTYPLSFVSAEG